MKYFNNCATLEDVKTTYKTLCKKYHPDLNATDTTAIMQEINAEYETAFNRLKNIHRDSTGKTYTKTTTETPQEFRAILEKVIHLDGITIELIGKWLWISGNTYKHRKAISAAGFQWAKAKKMWYYHRPEDAAALRGRNLDISYIRYIFGSETITENNTAPRYKQLA